MAELALQLDEVGVVRQGRPILQRVSLGLPRGQLLAILGPNGAGKSTLLKAVMGLVPATGAIRIEGQLASQLNARARARHVAYVPQHSALEAPLPVREVVAQGRFAHTDLFQRLTAADRDAVAQALEATDTMRLADRAFNRLSYGERRLVLLARALATGARLLLLDEPTAALDIGHALGLLRRLRQLAASGVAVAVVLHQLHEAADSCDRAVLLAGGIVQAQGPVAEVIAPEPVRRVYGVEMVQRTQLTFRLPEAP